MGVLFTSLLVLGFCASLLPEKQAYPAARLIHSAYEAFAKLVARQTFSLEEARTAYVVRRKREPFQGFDTWHALAQRWNTTIIEDFWDPIYEDLEQFRGVQALSLRARAELLSRAPSFLVNGLYIRNGTVSSDCQSDNVQCHEMESLVRRVAPWLPDMDLPINANSSPRVLVPYNCSDNTETTEDVFTVPDDYVQCWSQTCHPDSPVRRPWHSGSAAPRMPSGMSRWGGQTHDLQDICGRPGISMTHGALVRPLSLNVSTSNLPLFAPARLAIETAIRYPDTIYWAQDPDYFSQNVFQTNVSWKEKSNTAFWRGTNTGGGHGPDNWYQFHRHRFVALTNASYLQHIRSGSPDWTASPGPVTDDTIRLAKNHVDTGFSTITCRDTLFRAANLPCSYLDTHFSPVTRHSLDHILSEFRFLFDIDGNSFSGRYYTFLLSDSVVLKATLYKEWHDSRLVPWFHFVPLRTDFDASMWDILHFLLNHPKESSRIASSARQWALRVLRPEDMELYLLRLLLEWARRIEN